jgi:hypothetical protein
MLVKQKVLQKPGTQVATLPVVKLNNETCLLTLNLAPATLNPQCALSKTFHLPSPGINYLHPML